MRKKILIVLYFILLTAITFAIPASALSSEQEEDISKYVTEMNDLDETLKKELLTDICYYRYNVFGMHEGFTNINDYTSSYLDHYFEEYKDSDGWGASHGFLMSNRIYGPFDGGFVLYMSRGTLLTADIGGGTAAGDYWFPCGSSSFFYVLWKDREITRLGKAYDDGKISDDALQIMSKLIKGTETLSEEDKARIRKNGYYTFFEENVLEIKKAYLDFLKVKYKDDASKFEGCTIEDVTVKRYWELEQKIETSDDIYYEKTGFILYIYCANEELSDDPGKEIAGGYEFYDEFENIKFIVWKDGKFYSLQQAMSKGFISEETLLMMTHNYIAKDITLARKLTEEEYAAAKLTETSYAEYTETETIQASSVQPTETNEKTEAASSQTTVIPGQTSAENIQTEPGTQEEETTAAQSVSAPASTPKTGDKNVFMILAVSATALASILIIKKKTEK